MGWLFLSGCSLSFACGGLSVLAWYRAVRGRARPDPLDAHAWACRHCNEANIGEGHCLSCDAPPPWPCECDACAAALPGGRYRVRWGEDGTGEMVR